MADSDTAPADYVPLFADGQPIRVKDLAEATRNSRPKDEDEWDSEHDYKPSGKKGPKPKGPPINPEQLIFSTAAMDATWQVAAKFQEAIDYSRQFENRGRKPEYEALDALLFMCCTILYGGANAVHKKNHPHRAGGPADRLVDQINRSLEHSRPDNTEWRLNPKGFSRSQHIRVRADHLDDDVLDDLEKITRRLCVEAALKMGQFNSRSGTYTLPHTTQLIVADATIIRTLFNNGDPLKLNLATGKLKRCDTEAFTPRRTKGKKAKPPNYEWVLLITRTPHPSERIILAVNIKGEAQRKIGDATLAVDSLMLLLEEHPDLVKGLFAFGYDGALAAEDRDRLLKAGIQPVAKLRRITEDKPFMENFGEHEFEQPASGIVLTTEVICIDGNATVIVFDGNATVIVFDGNGDDWYVPLVCTNRRRTKQRTGGYAVTNTYALPDHPIVPRQQRGAVTKIRMDTLVEELKKDDFSRRSQYVSSFPESDPLFSTLSGVRQDCESTNNHYKSLLRYRRSITTTRNNNRYQAIGYQLLVLANALLAHAERTGSHHTDIFGQRLVPPSDKPPRPPITLTAPTPSSNGSNGVTHKPLHAPSKTPSAPQMPAPTPLSELPAAGPPRHTMSVARNGERAFISRTISRRIPHTIPQ